MEGRRGDGWVREGDEAPLFELPDTEFKPVSPLRNATKVSQMPDTDTDTSSYGKWVSFAEAKSMQPHQHALIQLSYKYQPVQAVQYPVWCAWLASSSPTYSLRSMAWPNHLAVFVMCTRLLLSVVTGQASVTLELRNAPQGKNTNKPKVVHAYITADAIHASARNI